MVLHGVDPEDPVRTLCNRRTVRHKIGKPISCTCCVFVLKHPRQPRPKVTHIANGAAIRDYGFTCCGKKIPLSRIVASQPTCGTCKISIESRERK